MDTLLKTCVILAVFHVTCSRIVKLPLTKTSYRQYSVENIENAHTRHSALRVKRAIMEDEYNLHGRPGDGYYLEVAIGTPPQLLRVLVDTGSSNFAVAASPQPELDIYFHSNESSTFELLGTEIYVPYTLGEWRGYLMQDVVHVHSLTAANVTTTFAGIEQSSQFFTNYSHWQGILGLAYPELARPDSSVDTFLDSLSSQTSISRTFALQLCGTVHIQDNSTELAVAGTMTLGGVDESLYTGDIQYTPVYKRWYYEVVMTDLKINGHSLDLPCKEYNFDKTIVDSGTTNFRLPKKVYDHFMTEIKQKTMIYNDGWRVNLDAEFWRGTEMLCYDLGAFPWDSFPTVTVTLATSSHRVFDVEITPRQYLMLTEPESDTGDGYCYRFAVSSSNTGTVLGAVTMEGLYVLFDREHNRVGFAPSTCPTVDPTVPTPTVSTPRKVHHNTTECAYTKVVHDEKTLAIAMYVMLTVIVLCMLPLVVFFIRWQYHKHCNSKCFTLEQPDQDNLLETTRTASSAASRKHYQSLADHGIWYSQ